MTIISKRLIIITLVIAVLFAASFYVYTEISSQEVEYTRGRLI